MEFDGDDLGDKLLHLSDLLQVFLDRAAFPGKHETLGVSASLATARPEWGECMERLILDGYVECATVEGVQSNLLTEKGLREIASAKRLTQPLRLFQVRDTLPLQDLTHEELCALLEQNH